MRFVATTVNNCTNATSAGNSVNLEADRMEREDDLLQVYNKNNLVAVFDVGVIKFAYMTGGKTDGRPNSQG